MLNTLIALAAAHVLADFVLQSAGMVQYKRRIGIFLLHISFVALSALLTLGPRPVGDVLALVAFVAAAHGLIDAIKTWLMPQRPADAFWALKLFGGDQVAHIASLAVGGCNLAGCVRARPLAGGSGRAWRVDARGRDGSGNGPRTCNAGRRDRYRLIDAGPDRA